MDRGSAVFPKMTLLSHHVLSPIQRLETHSVPRYIIFKLDVRKVQTFKAMPHQFAAMKRDQSAKAIPMPFQNPFIPLATI